MDRVIWGESKLYMFRQLSRVFWEHFWQEEVLPMATSKEQLSDSCLILVGFN